MRNEAFGRLLKGAISSIAHYEGKTAPIIEDELGQRIGVTGASIQRYKAGHLPPEWRTVEILAEAAVKRGYLNREWLQAFLRAAHHPASEKLVDRLCPIALGRPHVDRVYENLPAPTYSQFVMRQEAFDVVINGLQQRSAVVLIASLGGMGKTSLAREVATRCLKGEEGTPQFDAVVWVSDKDRPGTTTFSIVLNEIARTLDYPGFAQFEHEEKRREVEQLLRRQRVLVVVDNFETITDGALLSWLLRLPEPSKAMITSREKLRAFWSSWLIELSGMTAAEAQELISHRLRVLRMEKLVSDIAQFEPLVNATGGNPKAIEVALGLIKHERRPLQQVVNDLYAARGNLFDDLFARAWALLDEFARRVLLVMTFFPTTASGEALCATADVSRFVFDHAVERLTDLALLDVQQANLNVAARYTLHPLVQAFVVARLAEQPEFESGARDRWVDWYSRLTLKVGYCWSAPMKLELLDPEHEIIDSVLRWASLQHRDADVINIGKEAHYYYYVRGLWDKHLSVSLMCVESARHSSDLIIEADALSYYVEILSKQGDYAKAEKHLPRLHELADAPQLPEETFAYIHHAIALYYMACRDGVSAQQEWQIGLSRPTQQVAHKYVICRQWLADCLYQIGVTEEAQDLFRKALHDAMQIGAHRCTIFCKIKLASIDLDYGNSEAAAKALAESSEQASRYRDRDRIAMIKHLYARLYILRGDLPTAHVALTEAIDLFERLGMRRELAEAREELARLETTMALSSESTPT